FAAGGDPVAARNVGVPVSRVKIVLFIAMAMASALFASIQVLDAGSADTLRGQQKEFEAIIAVVGGGTLLTGRPCSAPRAPRGPSAPPSGGLSSARGRWALSIPGPPPTGSRFSWGSWC